MKRIEPPSSIGSCFVPNCPSQAVLALFADLWKKNSCPVAIVIGETLADAENKCEDISDIAGTLFSTPVNFHTFYRSQASGDPDSFDRTCERISLLSSLRDVSALATQPAHILVATTFDALLGPCPILENAEQAELLIKSGAQLSYQVFSKELVTRFDYSSEVVCEEPGQFAIRGGIIDVYPVNADYPIRIDFFGDTIEEIRRFDPTTQRTEGNVPEIRIASIRNETTVERDAEFLRYLPESVLWYIDEPENFLRSHPLVFHETGRESSEKANLSLLWKRSTKLSDFFLTASEIDVGAGVFGHSRRLCLGIKPFLPQLERHASSNFCELQARESKGAHEKSLRLISKYSSSGYQIYISVRADIEKKKIEDVFQENGLGDLIVSFLPLGLHQGFIYTKKNHDDTFSSFLSEEAPGFLFATSREILGRERNRRPIRSRKARVQRKEVDQALDFTDLVDGDLLVHFQHGICRFCSLGKIDQQGKTEEVISVEFADGILLHVPLQESHLLSRYVGLRKAKPKLAKMGGKSWVKTKEAAERAAIDLAADLLRLQASRDSRKGYSFSADDNWQQEFEESFPYSETPDQLRSIIEVKQDMESENPMDRLICGDVGYGKTEVAMRAAFKAVMDGKQVAVLAPTTILCQQHMQTFIGRMRDFPVVIEMLSRFRTASQQKKIMSDLLAGSIDVVIGTHRMFSDSLQFKDLGLLIIDEEQRFGVEHKEKLKRIKANIDVLTLSATPIPRTLYFAMVGVRSLSTIETAPVNRRPIRTEVIRQSDDILKKAIHMELRRGGQVFYLHNKVKTISLVAGRLQELFPKLRIATGHGQMPEAELEQVMVEFISGKYDLLLCTTIIESGLDIPNCNTIIIEEADKFGLSQLYQLRGRVGRFTRQAYAYLLVNPSRPVREKARKRLSALRSVSSMGAGFKIALRDLELRGAGNLLGSEQSGHIAGVGFEMYCKLLRESVSRLKGDEVALRPNAVVRLDFLHADESAEIIEDGQSMPSCLPSNYINEPRLRIEFYRKIANIVEENEIRTLRNELVDRFGSLPPMAEAFLLESEIKVLAQENGFDCIASEGTKLLCRKIKKSSKEGLKYFRQFGKLPTLNERNPLLKLKEIIRFLRIIKHGNI